MFTCWEETFVPEKRNNAHCQHGGSRGSEFILQVNMSTKIRTLRARRGRRRQAVVEKLCYYVSIWLPLVCLQGLAHVDLKLAQGCTRSSTQCTLGARACPSLTKWKHYGETSLSLLCLKGPSDWSLKCAQGCTRSSTQCICYVRCCQGPMR